MLAHETRLRVNERHHILQLISKTERTARLIVATARPETACERLVQQPAVGQHVDRWVRRLDMDCTESLIPILPYRIERLAPGRRSAKALSKSTSVIGVLCDSERENNFPLLTLGEIERNLDS